METPRLRFGTPVLNKQALGTPVPQRLAPDTLNLNTTTSTVDPHPAFSPMRLTPILPGQSNTNPTNTTAAGPKTERTETFRPLLPRPILQPLPNRPAAEASAYPVSLPAPAPPALLVPKVEPKAEPSRSLVFTSPVFTPPRPAMPPQENDSADREELALLLRNGETLESEARWREVLNHYETALRIYRNDETLMERYRVARFHYDIGLRFHDSSFLNIVNAMSFVEALKFFEDTISVIQSDYVNPIVWDDLFRHGVQNLEIAFSDRGFLRQAALHPAHLRTVDTGVAAFVASMRRTADGWEIRDRNDLRNGVLRLAEMAQDQLGLNPVLPLMEFSCGIVNSLDPYTAYLTPNLLNDQMSIISGNLVGLGVELGADRESLMVLRVVQGSPAETGGLKDGDRILTVDGVSTKGRDTDEAANLLQGKEGSVVTLKVLSPGFGQKPREVRITRRQIEVPSVENVRMLNAYTGYIKLTGFQSRTCTEMRQALAELDRQGMQCLVLDMRKNPGGLFLLGVEVASLFIKDGTIVRTKGRESREEVPYPATKGKTWDMPLVVLIDEESASAAEIVAGAIRDHERGVIVGKRSYGKGTIQKILPRISGQGQGGLRMTVEKFYSPNGLAYSGNGVSPDVPVDVEKRWSLAKLVDGKLQIPLQSRTVSSDRNDPFIRKAMETAERLVAN